MPDSSKFKLRRYARTHVSTCRSRQNWSVSWFFQFQKWRWEPFSGSFQNCFNFVFVSKLFWIVIFDPVECFTTMFQNLRKRASPLSLLLSLSLSHTDMHSGFFSIKHQSLVMVFVSAKCFYANKILWEWFNFALTLEAKSRIVAFKFLIEIEKRPLEHKQGQTQWRFLYLHTMFQQ